MKKAFWLVFISLILFTSNNYSQSNKAYCAQEITWFGLDYSVTFFTDESAFPDPYKLRDKLFYEWNNLVFKEYKKFDIAKSFNKNYVAYSTSFINNRNKRVDIFKNISNNMFYLRHFNSDSIQKIVDNYKLGENNVGVGLVIIVESLNKPEREATYWITFFDIKTKKVLLTEQITGIPSGAGIRNYWANSFYNALIKAEREMGFIF
jgi:hypothetical protein